MFDAFSLKFEVHKLMRLGYPKVVVKDAPDHCSFNKMIIAYGVDGKTVSTVVFYNTETKLSKTF